MNLSISIVWFGSYILEFPKQHKTYLKENPDKIVGVFLSLEVGFSHRCLFTYQTQVRNPKAKDMKTGFLKRWMIAIIIISISFYGCSNQDEDLIFLTDPVGDTGGNDGNNGSGNSGGGNNGGGTQTGTDGEITLYRVAGSAIEKIRDYQVSGQDLVYQNDVTRHQELWRLTKDVVPQSHRNYMNEFMIYNGEVTGSAGYVYETAEDLSTWQMGLAINYADDQNELLYTIIHEFGHILTLNNTQLDSSISSGSCSNYFPGEGCAKAAAFINKLYSLGWADIWNEYQQAQGSASTMQTFYNQHQDRFVTNYAATNPGEDIAEVFATFVTMTERPAGNNIAERKILLMYDEPELVQLRNYIRGNLMSGRQAIALTPGSWKRANTIGTHKSSYCGLHRH